MIKSIFPNAKFVNCKRNPLSSIISIIKNNLYDLPWAHKIDHIFEYFNLYFQYINFWNKILPNSIYNLDYEKFVKNPNEESKKLFRYCEIPWDKRCLEFYKKNNLISRTNSKMQIREAINLNSLDKYENYKIFLSNYIKNYNWIN